MSDSVGHPDHEAASRPIPDAGIYHPHLRTALVLTGTGTAGAYQAGVLRALQEAGVKIDLIAAHGVGAGTALLAAVDGAPQLWEPGGVWRDRRIKRLYKLRPALRGASLALGIGCAVITAPLLAIAGGLLVYPFGFVLQLVSPTAGRSLIARYVALVDRAFAADMLPTLLPRLALITVAIVVFIAITVAAREMLRRGDRRRDRGPWWGRVLGGPWSAREAVDLFRNALWHFLRGAAQLKQPPVRDLSRRYAEVLADNLGQPGFRELIITSHDFDARHDLVFALLAEPFRREFLRSGARGVRRRSGDVVDLAGAGREHVLDALAGSLRLPVLTDGHPIRFAVESYWRGETHSLSDRCGCLARLMDEVSAAGVRQVLVVSAAAQHAWPHGLVSRSLTFRARVAEYLTSSHVASLEDALTSRAELFDALFQITPAHNPVGPLDFGGCRDERSDRTYAITELIDRGYEDAYRQFIDPVVGGSGERLDART